MASKDGDIMSVEYNGYYYFASRHLGGTNISFYSSFFFFFFKLCLGLIPFPLWLSFSGFMMTINDNGRLQAI